MLDLQDESSSLEVVPQPRRDFALTVFERRLLEEGAIFSVLGLQTNSSSFDVASVLPPPPNPFETIAF